MATELAQAYVQIIPSAKGIKNSITQELGGEAESAGKSAGSSIASGIKNMIVAAGIGALLKSTIQEGAKLEQSFGGLDTIYGEASAAAKEYAKVASQAGISANSYAEQAVSFGASLKQAFGGDTVKAAESANVAIMDMADNSAKMGTDITSIQNAYQGFAKQNYTMLDNLKLGYGGTKTEMQRLLADAQKLSGVEYNIDNLGDVYEAIHVIQGELGVTGVAAMEASTTLSGSFGAMKADLSNFAAALTTGMDITEPLKALVQSTSTFLFGNLIPAVVNVVSALPGAIATVITEGIPAFIQQGTTMITSMATGITDGFPAMMVSITSTLFKLHAFIVSDFPNIMKNGVDFITNLADGIFNNLPAVMDSINKILQMMFSNLSAAMPTILQNGVRLIGNLAQGLLNNLPAIISSIVRIMNTMLSGILSNLPSILSAGVQLMGQLAQGLINNIPSILGAIARGIASLLATIGSHLPELLQKGIELIAEMGAGLIRGIPQLVGQIPSIIGSIFDAFSHTDWGEIGWNIISGIGSGLINGVGNLVGSAIDACASLVDGVKGFFGIRSPSRLMANEVGKYLPSGMAVGVKKNMKPLQDAMNDMNALVMTSAESELSMSAMNGVHSLSSINSGVGNGAGYTQNIVINSPTALSPSEISRQTRNQARQTILAMKGV